MSNIEMILKLMEPELDKHQLAKLSNVLETILRTHRTAPPNDELIERFIQHKRLVGLKDTSMLNYVNEIKSMNKFLQKGFTEVTTADIKDYLSMLVEERHLSGTTIQTKIRCMSAFYEFLLNEEYIDKNPTAKIEKVLVEKKIRKPFTEEDIENLRMACENKRDRAIIEFLYSTGTRISEMVALDVQDVNFNEGEVIVFGKGHKERVVYLSDIASRTLQEYLESRYAQPEEPLFIHLTNHHRINVRGVQMLLKDVGLKAGVENVYPHRFRHTMATHLMDRGMPIEQIKEVLGHVKIETTMLYVDIAKSRVKSSFKEAFNNDYNRYQDLEYDDED